MRFTTQLDVKVIGAQAYEVDSPLVYERENQIIQVNKGFDFDGASVPQVLWSLGLSPMGGGYDKSACLHDALYAGEVFEREMCDDLFLEAMESEGVNYFKRYAMYLAVRVFGWIVWNKHNEGEVNAYKKFLIVEHKPIMA